MGFSAATSVGVQSWCMRNIIDNAQVADLVRELGLSRIELCDVHADFGNPSAFAKIVQTYARAGVSVASLGVQTFRGNLDVEQKWFECAAAAGANHISAHFTVDTYQKAIPAVAKLCERFGARIGIHCHGGYMFGGSADVIDYLLNLGGPWLGLNLDTAWCMQLGPRNGDPVKWVQRFGSRVYAVHYKDFVFDRCGQWRETIVGEGSLNLPAFVTALQEADFDGVAVVECEADPNDPASTISRCVRNIHSSSGHAYGEMATVHAATE